MDIKQIKIEVLENLIAKLQTEVDTLKGGDVTTDSAPSNSGDPLPPDPTHH